MSAFDRLTEESPHHTVPMGEDERSARVSAKSRAGTRFFISARLSERPKKVRNAANSRSC
jgi:hypothetical protein